ncbi:MAG: hypothetical protein J7L54_05815 [Elusimicrobia bacterium]|nr:hypothetical protein [Elusimicrobiota bacterium]
MACSFSKKFILTFFVVFAFCGEISAGLWGSSEDAGSIDDFLASGVGARNLAMGRVGAALHGGSESAYWNPASLASLSYYGTSFMYNRLFFATDEFFAGALIPTQWWGNFAVSVVRLSVNDVDGWDSQNLSTGKIGNEKSAYFVSYGNSGYGSPLELGASFKISRIRVGDFSDSGGGFDAGMIYNFINPECSIGVCVRNVFGPVVNLAGSREAFPFSVRLGGAVKKNYFLGACDIDFASGMSPKLSLGVEFSKFAPASLRLGLNETEISFGFGYKMKKFSLDYAVAYHNAWDAPLGISQRFGISYRISEEVQKFKSGANKTSVKMFKKARKFFRKGQFFYCVDAIRQTLSMDNQNISAARLLEDVREKMDDGLSSGKFLNLEDIAYARAVLCYIRDDPYAAINQLRQVVNVDPSRKEAKNVLRRLEDEMEKRRKEEAERKRAEKINQLLDDGIYLYSIGEFKDASAKFKEVLELDPENKDAKKYLGLSEDEIRKAIEREKQKKQKKKRKPKPRPKPKKKKKKPKEVFERNPQKANQLYNDGLIEYSLGRIKRAISYWEMALKYDPENKKIEKAIKNAKKRME